MFEITTIEIIYVATTVISAIMCVIILNQMVYNLDVTLMNLKTLEKDIKELQSCTNNSSSNEDLYPYSDGREEINQILINENRKLHVRCDMLEEELRKTRELNGPNKKQKCK